MIIVGVPIEQPGVFGRTRTTQPRGSLVPGVSVSNPTPVVSVTLCDARRHWIRRIEQTRTWNEGGSAPLL